MQNFEYKEVTVNEGEKNEKKKRKMQWKPFLRQLLVCSGASCSMFTYGLCVGAPTVFIPQLRKEANSTDAVTDEMASWLSSAMFFSCLPLIIIVAIVSELIGKKITFIVTALTLVAGYVLFYVSSNIAHILIGQVIQSIFSATQVATVNMLIIEYTSPTYRGMFLLMNIATCYWGILVANAIGTFFHWKNIAIVGMVITMYIIVTPIMWPESPYWLASKGKFEECATAHRWLKGCDKESERELETIINSQKEYKMRHNHNCINNFWRTIRSKEFFKPTLIAITTLSISILCGKLLCAVYALDIIKQITNSESTAYIGMLILDGVTVFSMYVGCIFVKYLPRRRLLLASSSVSAIFLFALSFYLFIIKQGIIIENKYISMLLLTAFSIAVGCGPMIMGHSFYGELLPLKSRYSAFCLTALTVKMSSAIFIKNTPLLLKTLGLDGFFLFFGICLSLVTLILYKYFPETQGKTIQEITDSIRGTKQIGRQRATELLVKKNDENFIRN